jgi:hypothetical protein
MLLNLFLSMLDEKMDDIGTMLRQHETGHKAAIRGVR